MSAYKDIIQLYTKFPTLNISPLIRLFCHCRFITGNLPHLLFSSLSFPQATTCLLVLCIYSCFLLCLPFVFQISHVSVFEEAIWYLSFSFLLLSLSLIPSRLIHVVANGKISFFLWLDSVPLYTCTTPLSIHVLMGT